MANLVNLCSITSVAAATGVTEVKRFQTRVKRKKNKTYMLTTRNAFYT